MSPEQKLQQQIDRLDAVCRIQSAETASLLHLVESMAKDLRTEGSEKMQDLFLSLRKQILQHQLLDLSKTDKAHAARLQALIDQHCTQYPFDYQ